MTMEDSKVDLTDGRYTIIKKTPNVTEKTRYLRSNSLSSGFVRWTVQLDDNAVRYRSREEAFNILNSTYDGVYLSDVAWVMDLGLHEVILENPGAYKHVPLPNAIDEYRDHRGERTDSGDGYDTSVTTLVLDHGVARISFNREENLHVTKELFHGDTEIPRRGEDEGWQEYARRVVDELNIKDPTISAGSEPSGARIASYTSEPMFSPDVLEAATIEGDGSAMAILASPGSVGDSHTTTNPEHYKVDGMQAIDVIEAFDLGFDLGNAVKYILRCGRKDDPERELRKVIWYVMHHLGWRPHEQRLIAERFMDDELVGAMTRAVRALKNPDQFSYDAKVQFGRELERLIGEQ